MLVIKLLLAPEKELAKNCHGSMAAKTRIGYGTPSDGIFAHLPKTTVSTIIVNKGRNKAHRMPMTVCL